MVDKQIIMTPPQNNIFRDKHNYEHFDRQAWKYLQNHNMFTRKGTADELVENIDPKKQSV